MNDVLSSVDSSVSSRIIVETADTADQLTVIHNDLNVLIFLITFFIGLCLSAVIVTVIYKILLVCSNS